MNLTPNKRKRESLDGNAAFNKENYGYNQGFMEVKSLADVRLPAAHPTNPFEVVRKPPKKKTKCEYVEENCFVNPALNLNGPENVINPFEIRRSAPIATNRNAVDPHCFYNTGLNIRGPEKEVRNPFEIVRPSQANDGLENAGLNVRSPLISRAIAIPFTPTVGCRINFTDVPLESLTPCSMLAKKLVFSPAPPARQPMQCNDTPKKPITRANAEQDDVELSVISEESLDIIAELDCYQLELENSINEAKMDKKKRRSSAGRSKNLMDLKNRKSFALLLHKDEDVKPIKNDTPKIKTKDSDVNLATQLTPKVDNVTEALVDQTPKIEEAVTKENSSVDYEEVDDDDEFDFKNPAPFVRTFKRKSVRKPSQAVIHKSAESLPEASTAKSKSIGSSIRSSIRRILKPNQKKTLSSDDLNENVSGDNQAGSTSNLFASIRQSLRRKPNVKSNLFDGPKQTDHDLSILVDTERKVFRQASNPVHTSIRSHEDLGDFAKKSSLRSSFRNTGKDVRRQVMKSMFKMKSEEYTFEK